MNYKSFSVSHVFPPSKVMRKHNALEVLVKINVLGLENSSILNFGLPRSKVMVPFAICLLLPIIFFFGYLCAYIQYTKFNEP